MTHVGTGAVDARVEAILQEHLLQGPRPGQCRCGHGDANTPIRELGAPHSRHVVAQLRAAGVLKES